MPAERDRKNTPTDIATATRQRRSRSSTLPPKPVDRTLDFALARPELAGIEPGEVVLALEQLDGFHRVVKRALDAVDERRARPREGERRRRGRPPSFHALDYWRMEMLRRVIGEKSTQSTREKLTTDRLATTRKLLNFDRPRTHHGGKPRRWMAGIPSDGWMSDMRTRWLPEADLAVLMQRLERWALAEKMRISPDMREETRLLYVDGSKLETHATPPRLKDGRVINLRQKGRDGALVPAITAPEAGYVPNYGSNADHAGSGWNIIFITTIKGTVLAHRRVPLNRSESDVLTEMVQELGQTLDTFDAQAGRDAGDREQLQVRVLSADGGFHSQTVRPALHAIGVVENIHLASHSRRKSSAGRNTAKRDEVRYPIDGHPNWSSNGHRELVCDCGRGKVSRRVSRGARTGKLAVRAHGECRTCGSVLVTAGQWRLTQKPSKWVRCVHPADYDHADWAFGNPLTFNDQLASDYAVPRFNAQEGLFGSQLTNRFRLLKDKRWFYRQSQVDLEVATVITITHALSLERWRRMLDGTTGSTRAPHALAA